MNKLATLALCAAVMVSATVIKANAAKLDEKSAVSWCVADTHRQSARQSNSFIAELYKSYDAYMDGDGGIHDLGSTASGFYFTKCMALKGWDIDLQVKPNS